MLRMLRINETDSTLSTEQTDKCTEQGLPLPLCVHVHASPKGVLVARSVSSKKDRGGRKGYAQDNGIYSTSVMLNDFFFPTRVDHNVDTNCPKKHLQERLQWAQRLCSRQQNLWHTCSANFQEE